ncbi:uncharacterized protein SPAPADRAFT_58566 [Spathaspora passalidarum NRRL Y-27907]|uniref:Uncharacterized protein n=1 Tax=Spathaspora passalidarum (strain NRRL Y-27907 / 11-Y1) TaxID=619300 RepID=G3AGJ6_SPAPN|nr:uncharacterized protein SPAPADRAFT_58566 [Spathaspora passalidarum NRRL Y-27907]EGW35335.1 hypothetical protein SPAPADRAFT_58566 [Spathaspora passalidarum NRRL Y-27907]
MSINPNLQAFRINSNRNNNNNNIHNINNSDSDNNDHKNSFIRIRNKKSHKSRMNSRQNAANSPQLSKRPIQANYDTTSSILSDYEDLEFVEESSYVLFNPVQSNKRNESDILSLTNTTNTHAYSSDAEEDEGDESEDDYSIPERRELDEGSTTQLYTQQTEDHLSNKINSWYNSNNALLDDQLLISDNVASWNLDEAVMDENVTIDKTNPKDKTILKAFYGDELFKYLNPDEIARVKKFHKLTDIKDYLLDKENDSSTNYNSLLNQILYKLLLLDKHNDDDETDIAPEPETISQSPRFSGTTDYVNHLKRTRKIAIPTLVEVGTFSETTNGSSLIMCGGETTSSWNEI